MKLILKENVKKIGKKGDIVDVPGGHATNFLIPRKLAVVATDAEISKLKNSENIAANNIASKKADQKNRFNQIENKTFTIKSNANPEGKLFATVDEKVISKETGIPIKNIILKEGIKNIGEYNVDIKIGENKGIIIAKIES